MKRYRETDILNFFTKRKQVSDDGNRTEEVCAGNNSIGSDRSVANEKDLEPVSLNTVSVAEPEDLGESTVTDVGHQNDFGLAVGAKLADSDKFRFLTEFYTPPESFAWPSTTRIDRGKVITCRLRRS